MAKNLLIFILTLTNLVVFSKPKLNFVEEADWPPFTLQESGVATKGLSFDLITELSKRLNTSFQITLLPQVRVERFLEEGLADAATVMSKNANRLKYLEYSDALFQKRGLIFYNKDRPKEIQWQNYSDLAEYKIALVRGHNYGDDFEAALKKYNITVYYAGTTEQLFNMLLKKRVDLVLCTEFTAISLLEDKRFKEKFLSSLRPYYTKDYHIAFSKKSLHLGLLPKINEIIEKMKKEGILDSIVKRSLIQLSKSEPLSTKKE